MPELAPFVLFGRGMRFDPPRGTLAPVFTTERPRCHTHGLLLDDGGACVRCAREQEDVAAQRALGRLIKVALVSAVAIGIAGLALRARAFWEERPDPSREVAAQISDRNERKLTVYTTGTCPACRMARSYMDSHKIEYVERRVDEDESARAELLRLKGRGAVPTFVVEDEVLSGFDPQGILLERALARHKMR